MLCFASSALLQMVQIIYLCFVQIRLPQLLRYDIEGVGRTLWRLGQFSSSVSVFYIVEGRGQFAPNRPQRKKYGQKRNGIKNQTAPKFIVVTAIRPVAPEFRLLLKPEFPLFFHVFVISNYCLYTIPLSTIS
jgi:hypothetical protein